MKTHHLIADIESERMVLSEFQMDALFLRKLRFSYMWLADSSGVDWCVAHGKGTDSKEVLKSVLGKKVSKSTKDDLLIHI